MLIVNDPKKEIIEGEIFVGEALELKVSFKKWLIKHSGRIKRIEQTISGSYHKTMVLSILYVLLPKKKEVKNQDV